MEPKELEALIRLLDDTDEEVFKHVETKLRTLGQEVVPALEKAWEENFDPVLQSRIEGIIHQIQFEYIKSELSTWAITGGFDLLKGFILVSKYQYPDLNEEKINGQIESIRRQAWIELGYDMSPVEKVKVLNHVFYTLNGFSGNVVNYKDPQNSYINYVLETRKGNQVSLGMIYSIIAQKLDIPIFGVNLPQHYVLGYKDDEEAKKLYEDSRDGILFYINTFNKGFIFTKKDIDYFLKQLNLPQDQMYYSICSNVETIKRVIRNLIHAYEASSNIEKVRELKELMEVLE